MAVLPTNFKSNDPLNHDVVNDAFGQVNTLVTNIATVNTSINTTNTTLAQTQTVANKNQSDLATANQTIATQAAAITTLQTGLTAAQSRLTVLENATPPPAVPGKPTGLTAGTITTTSVVLSWTAPTGTAATGYQTQRAPAGTGTWTNGPATTAPTVTATVTGLTQGTSYDFRVVASNAAGPGGISDPITRSTLSSFTPSPAWTEIPTVSTITMDDGGLVTVTNGIIYLNGSPMGVSSQVILVVKSDTGRIYQENANFDWWYWDPSQADPWVFTSDPRPNTQPVSGIPPQAVAAGYTHPVLMNDFDSISEIAEYTNGVGPIKNWYTGGDQGDHYSNLGNMSVANSILSFNSGGTGFASMISTINTGSGPVTSAPGAPATNVGRGKLYRYGYMECKMRIRSRPGPGWPAWWGTALASDPGDHLEIDFMESQSSGAGHFNSGFLNWFSGQTPGRPFGSYFGALNATGYPDWNTVSSQSGIDVNTPGDWNVFGFLWTPTYFEFYFNSWARRQQGIADYKHSHYPTTTNISGFINNGGGGPITMTLNNGANQSSGMYLILGSAGCDIDWVHVWQ